MGIEQQLLCAVMTFMMTLLKIFGECATERMSKIGQYLVNTFTKVQNLIKYWPIFKTIYQQHAHAHLALNL